MVTESEEWIGGDQGGGWNGREKGGFPVLKTVRTVLRADMTHLHMHVWIFIDVQVKQWTHLQDGRAFVIVARSALAYSTV